MMLQQFDYRAEPKTNSENNNNNYITLNEQIRTTIH